MRYKNRKYHWPIELKERLIETWRKRKHFELSQYSSSIFITIPEYSIKDNHLRYTLSTCLPFEYKKNAISLMVSYEIALKHIAPGLRQLWWVLQINLRYVKALHGGLLLGEAILWHKGQSIGLIPPRVLSKCPWRRFLPAHPVQVTS